MIKVRKKVAVWVKVNRFLSEQAFERKPTQKTYPMCIKRQAGVVTKHGTFPQETGVENRVTPSEL